VGEDGVSGIVHIWNPRRAAASKARLQGCVLCWGAQPAHDPAARHTALPPPPVPCQVPLDVILSTQRELAALQAIISREHAALQARLAETATGEAGPGFGYGDAGEGAGEAEARRRRAAPA
jgi:hypothetical protein